MSDTGHKAPFDEECDNPDCRTCTAWRAYWAMEREESRKRYACTSCGALPVLGGELYTLNGRIVCKSCYEQEKAS